MFGFALAVLDPVSAPVPRGRRPPNPCRLELPVMVPLLVNKTKGVAKKAPVPVSAPVTRDKLDSVPELVLRPASAPVTA